MSGGIVELHLPAALLTELATHPDACGADGEWAAVIADLAAQYTTARTQNTPAARGAPGQDPAARFAGAVLRRHIQICDRGLRASRLPLPDHPPAWSPPR